MEIKIINDRLNVDLKPGDKIMSEGRLVGRKIYTFEKVSKNFEYHLRNDKNCIVVVGIRWFDNRDKRTFLLEGE